MACTVGDRDQRWPEINFTLRSSALHFDECKNRRIFASTEPILAEENNGM